MNNTLCQSDIRVRSSTFIQTLTEIKMQNKIEFTLKMRYNKRQWNKHSLQRFINKNFLFQKVIRLKLYFKISFTLNKILNLVSWHKTGLRL